MLSVPCGLPWYVGAWPPVLGTGTTPSGQADAAAPAEASGAPRDLVEARSEPLALDSAPDAEAR